MKLSLKRSRAVNFFYSTNTNVLPSVNEMKDLGVIFSSNLCFAKHIAAITKRVFNLLVFWKEFSNYLRTQMCVLLCLFNSFSSWVLLCNLDTFYQKNLLPKKGFLSICVLNFILISYSLSYCVKILNFNPFIFVVIFVIL